jgi:hypothetical protein
MGVQSCARAQDAQQEMPPMRLMMSVMLAALLLAVAPASAQQSDPADTRPLVLQLLDAAPDSPTLRQSPVLVNFIDFDAALALRGLERQPTASDVRADGQRYARTIGISGPQRLIGSFVLMDELPELVGFEFFDIAQVAEVGIVPQDAIIVRGTFDPEAVAAAHTARGYTAESDSLGVTLCPSDGCESGARINVGNRNPANPFGGDLGMSQPLIVTPSTLLNSRDFSVLVSLSGAAQGRTPSLSDDPIIQAAANILAYRPTVTAIQLLTPAAVEIVDATASSGRFANFAAVLETLPPLPPYALIAVAHTADDAYEYGDLLLIYPNAEQAYQANESLAARLAVINSVQTRRPFIDLLTSAGEVLPPQAVTDERTNISAVWLSVQSPLTPEAEPEDFAKGYLRLVGALIARDSVLLVPSMP